MNFKTEQIEKLQSLLSPNQLKIFMDIIRGYNTEIDVLENEVDDFLEEIRKLEEEIRELEADLGR